MIVAHSFVARRTAVLTCVVAVSTPFIQNDLVEDDWLIGTKTEHVVEIRSERNNTT